MALKIRGDEDMVGADALVRKGERRKVNRQHGNWRRMAKSLQVLESRLCFFVY